MLATTLLRALARFAVLTKRRVKPGGFSYLT